jgi:signal transduction histidine kinase
MSFATSSAFTRARAGGGVALLLRRTRQFTERAVQGLTWQGLVIVAAFSALYGLKARSGGVPDLSESARGMAAALMLFFPAYVLAVITAQFAPRRLVPRAFALALAIAAGVALGYALAGIALEGEVSWRGGSNHSTAILPVVLTAVMGLAILLLQERERAAAQDVHDEVERKLDLERRMSEARLQALQSQIEPHFLFNSLAHVRRLCRTNAPAGRAMLRHLAHYIGAAQPALKHAGIALAADAELAAAYLNIQQIRMGARLRFDVELPDEARAARVPPMTLTTLVENAIKHGLSPLEDGGEVRITARVQNDSIVVTVADSGQGFQSTLGSGVGLANTRARLAILHGAAASLALTMNVPRGVVATLVVPREPSPVGVS